MTGCHGIFAACACAALALCADAAALPAGYAPLEYIQGSGAQWINTGYTPQSTDTIEMEMEFASTGSNQAFWCARKDGSVGTFTFFWLTGGLRFDYNKAQNAINLATFTASAGTRYKVKADGATGNVTINDATVFTYAPAAFTVGGPLSVFGSQMNGASPGNYGHYRLYYFTVTSGGTPVVNLVPAERVSDGVCGVYDTVRNNFYTNAGSGAFKGVPVARALWTNAGGDGVLSNPANWTCIDSGGEAVAGALPDASTMVVFSGNFAVQIPTNTTFACSRVVFQDNATLTADCDWRGLGSDPKFSGSLDLAGFRLTVAGLTGDADIGSTAGNLIANPDFEQDVISAGEYKGMTPSGWTSGGTVGVLKNHSSYGGKIKNGSNWCRTAYNSYIQQVIVINKSATYKLTFNYAAAGDSSSSYVNSYYYVNLDGAALTGNTRCGTKSSKSYSKTFTLAPGSHTIRIGCPREYTNHAVNFDNVALVNNTLNKPSAGAGVLEVEVPEGETVTNSGIAFSGSVKMNIHKTGKGKHVMSKANTGLCARFAPSLYVKEGIVDKTSGGAPCGAQYSSVTVDDGAQLLIGGKGYWDYDYNIAGEGPDGRGAIVNDTEVASPWTKSTSYGYIRNVVLDGDATIGGSKSWGLQFYNYGATTMAMNGRTVTLAGTVLYAGNLSYSGAGRIVIADDATVEYYAATPSAPDCELVVYGTLQQHDNALSPVKSLLFAADGSFNNTWDTRPLFVVRDTYAPNLRHGSGSAEHPAVQLGASGYEHTTLDLSLFTNAFNSAATTFFGGSEVTVAIGERAVTDNERLVAWEAVPENVMFTPEEALAGRVALAVKEDGLYVAMLNADVPLTAAWTGNGAAGDFFDPLNWTCYNSENLELSGALPTNFTTVVISGSTKFSLPEGTRHPPWKEVRIFPERTTVTQWGRISYGAERNKDADISGEAWKDVGLFEYESKGQGDLSNLVGKNTTWSNDNLNNSQLRFDGWFYVAAEQAGHWKIRQKFDDYFAFRIDGSWVAVNNTYLKERSFDTLVEEGWHRFTIVCGDTWGGQGGILSPGNVPMLISINGGAEVQFLASAFTMGSAQPETLRLDADCDWTALGEIALRGGSVLDLNGHDLKVSGLSAGSYMGASVVNSSETPVTLTIKNASGSVTFDGVAVKGNISVVKKGEGTMRATSGSAYAGGLDIQGGEVVCGALGSLNPLGKMLDDDVRGSVRVGTNAVLELNAKYAHMDYRFILDGGTLKNSKGDIADSMAQLANVRLDSDSTWNIATSSGMIGSGYAATTLDLGGHTLTVPLTSGKNFWMYNAEILNGLVDVTSGGWLKVNKTSCRATTADFRINCALNMDVPMDVRDYYAVYGLDYNEGSGVINVHGRFVPSETHNYFRGCVMQNGSTIEFGARTTALKATSSFTKGANKLGFAAGAAVTIDLSKRTDNLHDFAKSENPFVIEWAEAPDASVNFKVDAATKRKGLKVKPHVVTLQVEGADPVTKSGLALVDAGSFVLFIR
jgi:hypothetical protein